MQSQKTQTALKKTNICVLENQTTDGNRNSECNKEREQDDRETK